MTTTAEAPTKLVGEPVRRVEDASLITGAAKYLDDLKLPGMTQVAILRSPYAHARIKSIDTTKAAAAPGVVAVFTGKDFEHLPALPCAWQAGGVENFVNTPRALEIDRVTFTGAGVAAVVAESKYAAEDALELIEVDWEPLDVVVDVEEAVAEGAIQLHENAPGNIVMDWSVGDADSTDQALGEAEVVVEQRLVNQRLIPTPIEVRGAAATYEPATGQYTVWMTSQDPHIMRLLMTAFVFGIPETKMRLHRASRRRRLRDEDLPLPRVRAHGGSRREGRPAGQVDGDEERELRRDDARPRPRRLPRGGSEARRHHHGAEDEDLREPRWGLVDDRTRNPDDAVRTDALRGLPDPEHLLPGARRLHEHRHGRRLPRRRPPGGDLRRRARRRPRRARARARPGRGAPPELHSRRRVPLRPRRHPQGPQVRHRRLREDA